MVFLGVPHCGASLAHRIRTEEPQSLEIQDHCSCCYGEPKAIYDDIASISEEFRPVASIYRIASSVPGTFDPDMGVDSGRGARVTDPGWETGVMQIELSKRVLLVIKQMIKDIDNEEESTLWFPVIGRRPEEISRRLPGTCEWIIDTPEFQDWLTDGSPILWLTGIAGSGKSVMSSFVVEYLTAPRSFQAITTSYFCDGRGEFEGSASQVLWTLTCRIAAQRSQRLSNSRFLRRVASIDASTVTLSKARYAFNAMLKSFGSDEKFFLIIDGIDECNLSQNLLLAEAVKSACSQKQPPHARCFISSRPSYGIRRCLDGVPKIDLSQEVRVGIDIAAYVTSKVSELSLKAPQYELHHERLIEDILSRSHGIFLLVSLQTDLLFRDIIFDTKAIEVMIEGLPSSLEKTYERMFQAIHRRDRAVARKIFSWVIYGARPLRVDELTIALSIDANYTSHTSVDYQVLLDPEKGIRQICGGLVTIAENGSVLLVHQSVKEYLLFSTTAPMWTRNLETWAKESIARTCIYYLMFDSVGGHPDLTFYRSRQTQSHHGDTLLLEYATKYWGVHYRQAEDQSSYLPCLLQHFLESRNGGNEYYPDCFVYSGIRAPVGPMESPLHICSRFGFVGLAKMYLEMGADVDANSQICGGTALHHAAAHGHLEIARLLLTRGADVNVPTITYGETPLHLAVTNNHFDMVMLLLESGSDIYAVARASKSLPWKLASDCGHFKIMQFLLEWERIGKASSREEITAVEFSGSPSDEQATVTDAYEGRVSHMGALGGLRWLVVILLEMGADLAPSRRISAWLKRRPGTSKLVLRIRNGKGA
ncbi:hypothetical protein GP486_003511 [Trichoglossum hirsutum]|uniref:NACHT domain-containing protein n=1 Tax=Trichoglossum hirsutum TaxID=265104 RepID=A0A9P8LCZ9_9PEZI|nr:hypothetical protein GP486_003511 [Trichoglossum hirsutum]